MKLLKIIVSIVGVGLCLLVISYFIFTHFQEPIEVEDVPLTDIPGKTIDLSKGTVHYQLSGPSSGELVVLIHGGGVAGLHVWDKTIPFLINSGYQVLSYDLYGRGYSSRPETIYKPELLYDQFSELLDSLEITQPFHLVAQSMGAMIAANYTAENPNMVKKLVFIAPATLGAFAPKWYLNTPLLSNFLMTFYWYPQSVSSQMKEFYSPEEMQEYKKQLLYFMEFDGYKRVNLSTWLNTYTVNLIDTLKVIGKLNEKVLLILGKEDPLIPEEVKQTYQTAIPQIEIEVIEMTGHMPHYERPADVNPLILHFLGKQN